MTVSTEEAGRIAKDAYVYAFRSSMALAFQSPISWYAAAPVQVIAGTNSTTMAVSTPADKAVQTPSSDAPISFAGVDLRAEPLLLTVPRSTKTGTTRSDSSIYTFDFLTRQPDDGDGAGNFSPADRLEG